MNTNQNTQNKIGQPSLPNLNTENKFPDSIQEQPIIHEAEIITPQPYGIYALCKIMEHFQIN